MRAVEILLWIATALFAVALFANVMVLVGLLR